jgi:predicted transcriptional regulator
MKTRVVTAHIPVELAEQLDELATRLERPKGWIVRQALAAWVALEAKRHQLTLEGLADVDAGRVVDQSAIESWANGLDQPA